MAVSSNPWRSYIRTGIGFAVLAGLLLFFYLRYAPPSPNTEAYFSSALRSSASPATVIVENRSYLVVKGQVRSADGNAVSSLERARVLQLAYALLLVKKAPLLSLEGSNPDLVREATDRLSAARDALADLQGSNEGAYLIRHTLYPVDFLRSLETLERARVAFVASGRDSAGAAYRAARLDAIRQGIEASSRLSRAISDLKTASLPAIVLEGKITRERMLDSLDAIERGFASALSEAEAQDDCLNGKVDECPAFEARLPEAAASPLARIPGPFPATLDILKGIFGSSSPALRTVALEPSACMRGLHGPDYIYPYFSNSDTLLSYAYVGDFILQPIDPANLGPVVAWFKAQNVSNIVYDPLIFYTCPDAASDIARSKSLLLAGQTLSLLPNNSDGVLYESDILPALAAAADAADPKTAQNLWALYWGYYNRTAGMEDIIYNVAHGLETVVAMHNKGIPTDLSVDFLFSTHSGYYGLLLAHNRTARSGQPVPYEEDLSSSFLKRFVLYSSAKPPISVEELIRDEMLFLGAHK